MHIAPRCSFTRPSDTTPYGASDLVANDVDAADVVPLSWAVNNVNGRGKVLAVNVFTDNETVTLATFALDLFRSQPAPSVGDNGVYAVPSVRDLIGTVACDLATGANVSATDKVKRFAITAPIAFEVGQGRLWGLLRTTAGYTPASAEVIEVGLEIEGLA